MKDRDKSIEAYTALREEIDQEVAKLERYHQKHLACKKGCDLCCLNFSVFPVEFEAIRRECGGKFDVHRALDDTGEPGSCLFLKNHSCTLYASRPIICRTHGLPLFYLNNDNWELSHCELNFTGVDEDYFDEEHTFAQDKWNSRLFLINREYVFTHPELKLNDTDLIPLIKLVL